MKLTCRLVLFVAQTLYVSPDVIRLAGTGRSGREVDAAVLCSQVMRVDFFGSVIEALMAFAKEAGCYKVILDCGESNVAFYEKCGLTCKEVQMVGTP